MTTTVVKLLLALGLTALPVQGFAESFIIENGAPRAEIIISDNPTRTQRLAARKNDDSTIWYGDCVEILLETDRHSYYQIAVSPAGAIVDLDRSMNKANRMCSSSQAEVATHIADDHWIVEIDIPVTGDENDPYHRGIGNRPTVSLPWHINLWRQRIHDGDTQHSAFAPTQNFHVPMKFGHFHKGRSHQFEADPSVTEYIIESARAAQLTCQKKNAEALTIYLALADDKKATLKQETLALERAANCPRHLGDHDLAKKLTERLSK